MVKNIYSLYYSHTFGLPSICYPYIWIDNQQRKWLIVKKFVVFKKKESIVFFEVANETFIWRQRTPAFLILSTIIWGGGYNNILYDDIIGSITQYICLHIRLEILKHQSKSEIRRRVKQKLKNSEAYSTFFFADFSYCYCCRYYYYVRWEITSQMGIFHFYFYFFVFRWLANNKLG